MKDVEEKENLEVVPSARTIFRAGPTTPSTKNQQNLEGRVSNFFKASQYDSALPNIDVAVLDQFLRGG